VAAGVTYGRMRKDYERAVDVYNDSLGLRLGLYDAQGEYLPPKGVRVDEEGFVILDTPEDRLYGPPERPAPAPEPEPTPEDTDEGDAPPIDGGEEAAPVGEDAAAPTPADADEKAAPAPAPKVQRPDHTDGALVLLPLR
jgi:catechol 2,3-dioxygenase-like lactoylglutathione lyase family enzyme